MSPSKARSLCNETLPISALRMNDGSVEGIVDEGRKEMEAEEGGN